jgi:hypothetical protein
MKTTLLSVTQAVGASHRLIFANPLLWSKP